MKRRREKKTNYRRRLALLKSRKPRLVVRCTNTQLIAQIVGWGVNGDITLVEARGKDIQDYGWKAPLDNLPASYLIGLVIGRKALDKNIKETVLDIGLQTSTPQNKLYALAKGVVDAGLNLPLGKEMLPNKGRIKGKHIAQYYEKNKNNFSNYQIDPKNIEAHFQKVKSKIMVNRDE